MSTEFDQISLSIIQEQKRIQQNQQERNKKFNQCLESYLNHLKQETNKLQATERQNNLRNEKISSAFQNVYERIMNSSQVAIRKVKETCYQKKKFWQKLIQNNASLKDVDLKKQFYQQKRDATDRYYDAIQSQAVKRVPYNVLQGKLKQKQSLKQWQANNKKLENEVTKGTMTLRQWKITQNKNTLPNFYGQRRSLSNDSEYFINQFATQPQNRQWNRTPLHRSRYNDYDETNSILKSFQRRAN